MVYVRYTPNSGPPAAQGRCTFAIEPVSTHAPLAGSTCQALVSLLLKCRFLTLRRPLIRISFPQVCDTRQGPTRLSDSLSGSKGILT